MSELIKKLLNMIQVFSNIDFEIAINILQTLRLFNYQQHFSIVELPCVVYKLLKVYWQLHFLLDSTKYILQKRK